MRQGTSSFPWATIGTTLIKSASCRQIQYIYGSYKKEGLGENKFKENFQ